MRTKTCSIKRSPPLAPDFGQPTSREQSQGDRVLDERTVPARAVLVSEEHQLSAAVDATRNRPSLTTASPLGPKRTVVAVSGPWSRLVEPMRGWFSTIQRKTASLRSRNTAGGSASKASWSAGLLQKRRTYFMPLNGDPWDPPQRRAGSFHRRTEPGAASSRLPRKQISRFRLWPELGGQPENWQTRPGLSPQRGGSGNRRCSVRRGSACLRRSPSSAGSG